MSKMLTTIRGKLFLSFIVVIILLVVTGMLMVRKLAESNQRLEELVDIASKRVSISQQLLIHVLDVGRQEKNLILEKDAARKEFYRNRIDDAVHGVENNLPRLYQLLNEEGRADLDQFKTIWAGYKTPLAEIVAHALNNEEDAAFKISGTTGYQTRSQLISIVQRIVERNELFMLEQKKKSDESYASSINSITALILIGLICFILLGYWIITSIANRIAFISAEAEKIASREFSGELFEDKTNDELKVVFDALKGINASFQAVTDNANRVASGDFGSPFTPRSERDLLGNALKKMTLSLSASTEENKRHIWLSGGQNELNASLRGDRQVDELAGKVISFLARYVNAQVGAVYLLNETENVFILSAGFALAGSEDLRQKFAIGEGLVGQAAQEQKPIIVSDITEHIMVRSAVLDAKPGHLILLPLVFEGKTLGVIELGKLTPFTETEMHFINASLESIGISMNSAIARRRIQQLLEETQVQSEELQSQQEELRQVNEELEEQTQSLKQQQEELQITNEELEEQTQALEAKNQEVEIARYDLEQKSKQLELSSKYKSEFLANMSHELRTPLNSLMILSRDMADNRSHNLTPDQVESAEIIYQSGNDLLELINEVLDLAKVESGKMSLHIEEVDLLVIAQDVQRNFKHQAETKKLGFSVQVAKDVPIIHTDMQRLTQIVNNLMSNALKFTSKGKISVDIRNHGADQVAISVTDTGIGIPPDKQMLIFEAFQQADGGTSRKYGGTGLGLSISRELAKLMGAEIRLVSKTGEGSTFTLLVPIKLQAGQHEPEHDRQNKEEEDLPPVDINPDLINYPALKDDRESIYSGDKVVLIIEDDQNFAKVLLQQAAQKGFKCLAAVNGEEGLALAEKYKPNAILLDMHLPGIDGNRVLLELRSNPFLKNIPVHVMSADEYALDIKEGIVEYLNKPVDREKLEEAFSKIEGFIERKMKSLLIVEDDENSRKVIRKVIQNGVTKCFEAATAQEALNIFKQNHIDCIVLDIGLPDMSGFDLIPQFAKVKQTESAPPIIVYTGKELTRQEQEELRKYAETIIIKGTKSAERLLDETALFLHRAIHQEPRPQPAFVNFSDKEDVFAGKNILLVDDDMRNIISLSKVLRERNINVIKAENGLEALRILGDNNTNVHLVLMDIMMPEMDGYEAMRKIREQPRFKQLPIIALTAKAMKEDKHKCIAAGASDYISKPVDIERLMTLMRVWLGK